MDLEKYYDEAVHPSEAHVIMSEQAVVPLGTCLWP